MSTLSAGSFARSSKKVAPMSGFLTFLLVLVVGVLASCYMFDRMRLRSRLREIENRLLYTEAQLRLKAMDISVNSVQVIDDPGSFPAVEEIE
jgi:hypothetical protein